MNGWYLMLRLKVWGLFSVMVKCGSSKEVAKELASKR